MVDRKEVEAARLISPHTLAFTHDRSGRRCERRDVKATCQQVAVLGSQYRNAM
jgi:hypothetical protein